MQVRLSRCSAHLKSVGMEIDKNKNGARRRLHDFDQLIDVAQSMAESSRIAELRAVNTKEARRK